MWSGLESKGPAIMAGKRFQGRLELMLERCPGAEGTLASMLLLATLELVRSHWPSWSQSSCPGSAAAQEHASPTQEPAVPKLPSPRSPWGQSSRTTSSRWELVSLVTTLLVPPSLGWSLWSSFPSYQYLYRHPCVHHTHLYNLVEIIVKWPFKI